MQYVFFTKTQEHANTRRGRGGKANEAKNNIFRPKGSMQQVRLADCISERSG
jgi:hypothetical protein